MDFSSHQIALIIQGLIILVLSICVHEYGHAIVADKLGDSLPRSQGRTTLNPAAHADPIGTLAFPLMALLITKGSSLGFGWGKPVMVSPRHFSRRFSMRTGHLMVAAAGPAMNILFGLFLSGIHLALLKTGVLSWEDLHKFLTGQVQVSMNGALVYAVQLNFVLAFFNLIPAPPLDGGTVLEGILPSRYLPTYEKYSVYGPFVLMGVIFIPGAHKIFTVPATWLFVKWEILIGILA